ncbi:MAG: general secretion pathway protein GspE [Planctomycetaceae bacterium]|nr:general secretion pathway protein GspE [Planctomycetaceae bacterium]
MAIDVYKEWLGIPEAPRPPDHYELLRLVKFEDGVEKIRGNYKKLNTHVRRYATGQYLEESQALLNELAKVMLCLTDLERKREYDIELGRVFDEVETGPRTMDVILLEQGHISSAQAQEARDHADRAGLELRDAFVQLKIVDPDLAAQALAQELGLSYVELGDLLPEDEVLDRVPRKTVKQHSILPLFIDQGMLLVACVHLIDHELEEELRLQFGVPVRNVLASPMAINQAIAKYYAPGVRNNSSAEVAVTPEKGKGKPAAKKEPPNQEKRERRTSVKSPDEIREQRFKGIIAINFSFLVVYFLDWLVITPNVFFDKWTFLLILVIPGSVGLISWQLFFKK